MGYEGLAISLGPWDLWRCSCRESCRILQSCHWSSGIPRNLRRGWNVGTSIPVPTAGGGASLSGVLAHGRGRGLLEEAPLADVQARPFSMRFQYRKGSPYRFKYHMSRRDFVVSMRGIEGVCWAE